MFIYKHLIHHAPLYVQSVFIILTFAISSILATDLDSGSELYDNGKKEYNNQNFGNAFKLFSQAAEQGHAGAQYDLSRCYYEGKGTVKNTAEAVNWLRKAVEQGHVDARKALDIILDANTVIISEINDEKTNSTITNNLQSSNINAPEDLGQNTIEQYIKERKERLLHAAEQGDIKAQDAIGDLYRFGMQNDVEAIKWYRQAVEQGHTEAQVSLAVLYANEQSAVHDDVESMKWTRRAAEQGNANAQGLLGAMYNDGRIVAQDYTESVKWYRRTAEQGHARAQSLIGSSYGKGQGVMQSDTEAVKWVRKAAEQGYGNAQVMLGLCYEFGKGIPQSAAEAMKWYRIAAEQGNAKAREMLNKIYRR